MSNVINIFRGDCSDIEVNVTREQINFDLSDYKITFTVKKNPSDTEPILQIDSDTGGQYFDRTEEDNGKIIIKLESTHTDETPGNYWYDVEISNETNTYTLVKDKLIITRDLT